MWILFKRVAGGWIMIHESDLKSLATHPNVDRYQVELRSDIAAFECLQFETFHTIFEAALAMTRQAEAEEAATVLMA